MNILFIFVQTLVQEPKYMANDKVGQDERKGKTA